MITPYLRVFSFLLIVATIWGCGSSPGTSSTAARTANDDNSAPALERMLPAAVSGKIGAPVDVRYLWTSSIAKGQPASVELAFVPRFAVTNLQVEFPASDGVTLEQGNERLIVQKSAAAEVHRRRLSITPKVDSGATVRAIVSVDAPEGRFFSVFVIPLDQRN